MRVNVSRWPWFRDLSVSAGCAGGCVVITRYLTVRFDSAALARDPI